MRLEESILVKQLLKNIKATQNFKTVVNLGSGNIQHLLTNKPWVNNNVFEPFILSQINVLHVDYRAFPGVNLVQDLSLPNGLDFAFNLDGPRLFILANVLEHIPNSARKDLLNKIYSAMRPLDYLLITVPHDYPYHADPIDTMYRPSLKELSDLIPLNWIEQHIIECGSYKDEFQRMSTFKKIRKLIKPL